MAGLGLVSVKRRIKSVTNTKKITKAMGLVATSKLRKTREALDINSPYYDSFITILNEVLENHEINNVYKDGNGSRKRLYVVLTSDSGLCGSFNLNILNRALEEINKDRENSLILVIGEKGLSFFNRFNYDIYKKYINIPDIPALGDANTFAMDILSMYKSKEAGEVYAVYDKFLSSAKQEVTVEKILPLEKEKSKGSFAGKYLEFEPKSHDLLEEIIPLYMRAKMLNLLIHSKSSEQSVRMSAMDGATKNANELLDKLKLQFNRMRQSAITQEISEIVGGAEAQK